MKNKKFKFTKVQKKRLLSIGAGALLCAAGAFCAFMKWDIAADICFVLAGVAAGIMCVTRAFRGILRGEFFDENTLMTIAAVGAVCIGEYPECAAVMILYQVGELFQSIAVGRSRKAISELSSLCPDKAHLVTESGEIKDIAATEVEIGNIIKLSAGERVPVDCVICDGATSIDTSPVTGESVPRDATVGDTLYSGCINKSTTVLCAAIKRAEDSAAGRILKLTETASDRKTKSEAFITRFAKVYTPAVALIAAFMALIVPLIIFLINRTPYSESLAAWSYRALSMLVISCPCALVISVPLGYFCGLGNASKQGILIKGSAFVDTLANVDIAVFDKTGTLTVGSLSVEKVDGGDDVLRLAAAAEQDSSHPIAIAICKAAGTCETAENITEIPGVGVFATQKQHKIAVKRPKTAQNRTSVEVYKDEILVGTIYFSDTIKEDTSDAISSLKKCGIKKTVMLTGDNEESANAVGEAVGIDKIYASLMPEEKFEKIEELCSEGCVMYAGDGINDSPSLARADVGVAMGALGSGAAIEAADVVLMSGELSRLAYAKRLARKTKNVVLSNIIISLGVKIAVLVLASFNLVGMWAAILADVGVCIVCVTNSMRLLRK